MTIPWAYFSYKNIHKKESIVTITICLILLIISCTMIIYGSYKNPIIFRFHNQTHIVLSNPFVGATAGIFLLLTLSIFIRKQLKFNLVKENFFKMLLLPKGKVSIAFRNFSLYIVFIISAALFGILVYTGAITSSTGLAVQLPLSIFSYFFITIAYLHSFPNKSSFMVKMVGISLVLILIIVTHMGYLTISWQEGIQNGHRIQEIMNIQKFMDYSEKNSIADIKQNINYMLPKGIQYIASRPLDEGLFSKNYSLMYNKSDNISAKILNQRDKKEKEKLLLSKVKQIIKEKNLSQIKGPVSISEVKKIAISKINAIKYENKISKFNRKQFYHDVMDFSTYYIYYNFIHNDLLYEVGYKYHDYRKELHKVTKNIFVSLIVAAISILIILPIFFHFNLMRRLNILLKGLKKVDSGDLETEIPFEVADEIGLIANSFNQMVSSIKAAQSELKYYAENLENMVKKRTRELQSAMEELEAVNENLITSRRITETDLSMAINVQKSIFPKEPPKVKDWDIAFSFKPLSGVSGDFYDFYTSNGKLQGLNLSDVSGHGIASALITMIARSVFYRHFTENYKKNLSIVMGLINHDIIQEIDNVDNYITSILLRFNDDTVEYVNAGHTDLLCKKADSGDVEVMYLKDKKIRGSFLGFTQFEKEYNQMDFHISKNDTLLLYTDSLIESTNMKHDQYENEHLKSTFESCPDGSAQEILDYILNDFDTFMGSKNLSDDLTIMVLKRKI
ncbi:SpoIIE family protein phosphatase [Spirochaetota bacterium]